MYFFIPPFFIGIHLATFVRSLLIKIKFETSILPMFIVPCGLCYSSDLIYDSRIEGAYGDVCKMTISLGSIPYIAKVGGLRVLVG